MPIPKVKKEQSEDEYISACISKIYDEYPSEGQAYSICKGEWDKMSSEDITDDIDEVENIAEGFVYANKESEEFATLPTTDCMEKHKSAGYTEAYATMACKGPQENDGQQGGVAQGFGRTKFEYSPNWKESMPEFMSRCMSDGQVRERKRDRATRAGFCYAQYQNKYIANLAKGWK